MLCHLTKVKKLASGASVTLLEAISFKYYYTEVSKEALKNYGGGGFFGKYFKWNLERNIYDLLLEFLFVFKNSKIKLSIKIG